MQATTDAFKAAIKKSQTIITKAEILSGGVVQKQITTLTGGQVSFENRAAILGRCEVAMVDPDEDLVPTSSGSLLAPYGNEIRLYRGLRLSTGDEYVCLGTFRISRVRVRDSEDGLRISVMGFDRSREVARSRLTAPYQIASGTNYGTAIQNLVAFARPGTTFSFVSVTETTPVLTFLEGDDPWRRALEMAEAIGCRVFFDALGVCTMERVSNTDAPVATYSEGAEATFLTIDRDLDDEKTYNGVIASGEGPDLAAPVRAEVWDANVASPTYYLGSYGKVPFFYSSPYLLTAAQAQAAATAKLTNMVGTTESVVFDAIVNPAHEVGDVVQIERALSGVTSTFVLDDLTIPLEAERPMTVRLRERRSLT